VQGKNQEGYRDPTAAQGMGTVVVEEKKQDKLLCNLINHIRFVSALAGFEVVGKITFRCKNTGRIMK